MKKNGNGNGNSNSSEELKFSTLKIKRIIQENKEIGKIANMTPYVICKFFNKLFLSKIFYIYYINILYIK